MPFFNHVVIPIHHALVASTLVSGLTFPYEDTQLSPTDVADFPSVSFGDPSAPGPPVQACKIFPGDSAWPSESAWAALNTLVDGQLLKPTPIGAACDPNHASYNSTRCAILVESNDRTYMSDPLTVFTVWPQGDTCPVVAPPGLHPRPCVQGGFPVYVVNATTVKHIQAAVNFARNHNIRLVVKNTGHDFTGRSTGAGALSIWTHHLKASRYIAEYTSPTYSGKAVQLGPAVEAWEMYNIMADYGVAFAAPSQSVGMGGWMLGGGHGTATPYLGLGADQIVELNVVTADGRFVAASSANNTDLFWALRGSGVGPAFGIVTSAIVRAREPINLVTVPVTFYSGPKYNTTPPPTNPVVDRETFWRGINAYFKFGVQVGLSQGVDFNFIRNEGGGSFSFNTNITFAQKSTAQALALLEPLYRDLAATGVKPLAPTPTTKAWAAQRTMPGNKLGNLRYSSRLWPRSVWADDALFARAMQAVRASVEEGSYTFHGLLMTTDPEHVAIGRPAGGPNSVSRGWRAAAMHASVQDATAYANLPPAEWHKANERILRYSGAIREATPGGGAYINEGDAWMDDWQDGFFGLDIYDKLLGIKRSVDPWGLFWARTTVGSEGWEVKTEDGTFTQNGRLCRTGEGA